METYDRSLTEFLTSVPVFREAGPSGLRTLLEHLQPVEVAAGDLVVRQGDMSDGLYVVVTGRLRVSIETADGEAPLSELSRGQVFGEIALLSAHPRTATVRAVRDSFLLRLPQRAFEAIAASDPGLMMPLTNVVIERLLRHERDDEEERLRTFAMLPLADPALVDDVVARLAHALRDIGPTMVIDSDTITGRIGAPIEEITPGGPHSGEVLEMLRRFEAEARFVIYRADPSPGPWTEWCLREADRIVLVADAGADPGPAPTELAARRAAPAEAQIVHELLLVRPASRAQPRGTARWLDQRPGVRHHHLRRGVAADHGRAARALAGHAQGLVLGGGGARGFAHLGVMLALEEAGIPVDIVGGTSIGAVMGGFFAIELDHAARLDAVEEVFLRNSLFRPTLPVVSLTSGRAVARLLDDPKLHAHTPIEDLPRGYFCISANLSRAEVVVHERGPISAAMRASFSIPGIFPPVSWRRDLLVDGGVMNNLPVDVMRARLDGGRIIAVDLRPDVDLTVEGEAPLALSGWQVARDMLMRRPVTVPNIAEILLRTLELGSTRSQRDALAAAATDLYLRPPVAGCGLLDFKGARQLIEPAYRATLTQLEDATSLVRTPS